MTSSVSVVRAWERHVSHTSSPIFTEVSDISAAAGRCRRRSAGVSGGAAERRWAGGCGARTVFGNGSVTSASGVACAACLAAVLGPGQRVPCGGVMNAVRLQVGPGIRSDGAGPAHSRLVVGLSGDTRSQAARLAGYLQAVPEHGVRGAGTTFPNVFR